MEKKDTNFKEQEDGERFLNLQPMVIQEAIKRNYIRFKNDKEKNEKISQWITVEAGDFRQWILARLDENKYITDEELIEQGTNYFFLPS